MTLHTVQPKKEKLNVHVIPVPVGMTAEESWVLISKDVLLVHPKGEPSWAAILVNENGEFLEVLK